MKINAFINGMVAGIVIGLLIAPSSGEETIRNLYARMSRFKNSLQNEHDDAEKNVIEDLNELNRDAKNDIDEALHQ